MSHLALSRRALVATATAMVLLPVIPAFADGHAVHVAKDPNCPCCKDWVAILQGAGFTVTVEEMEPAALEKHKTAQGVPSDMRSCHTGVVDGYALEGHVPVADIRRLLQVRPEAIGLAVPGMPFGSPGMGPESQREAYSVYLVRKDGSTEVFSSYAAA